MVPAEHIGTGFAPYPPDEGRDADSGKAGAGEPALLSAFEVPPYAAPACLCLRFLPYRRGTRFTIQILDLATGSVLDELAPRELAELPRVLGDTARWVFSR
ncbi:MAG: hypothetical protein ACODAJ_01435 [Planctomycetota bacterium]